MCTLLQKHVYVVNIGLSFIMNNLLLINPPPRGCAGGRIGTKFLLPRGTRKWDRDLLRLEGASVGCAGCMNSQRTRPSDETYIKPRSCVERLPPSSHVKEPSVTAHYKHYAHDE